MKNTTFDINLVKCINDVIYKNELKNFILCVLHNFFYISNLDTDTAK